MIRGKSYQRKWTFPALRAVAERQKTERMADIAASLEMSVRGLQHALHSHGFGGSTRGMFRIGAEKARRGAARSLEERAQYEWMVLRAITLRRTTSLTWREIAADVGWVQGGAQLSTATCRYMKRMRGESVNASKKKLKGALA